MNVRTLVRTYRAWARSLTLAIFLSSLAAIVEAITLVLVGPLATMVADGRDHFDGSMGPVSLELSRWKLVSAAVVAALLSLVLQLLSAWVRARIVASHERNRRHELIDTYLRADFDVQRRDREGRLQTRFGGFISQGSMAMTSLVGLVTAGISMLVLFISSVLISPVFAGFMAGCAVILATATRPLISASRRAARELADAQMVASEQVAESTNSVREITTFGVQDPAGKRLDQHARHISSIRRRQILLQGAVTPVYQALGLLVVITALAFATAISGIDLAAFGAVAILLLRSVSYGQQLQTTYQRLTESLPYIDMLNSSIEDFIQSQPGFGAVDMGAVREVRIESVSYTYSGETDRGSPLPALADVSLVATAGEAIGIVGPSGSGKSTLAQVLLRLRQPESDCYVVNGQSAFSYSPDSWARQVALVPQESMLLHGSIADNIRFYRDWISDDAIIEAARRAAIHDIIAELPNGYETMMGPSVRALSGGQLQRLSIARALAGKPTLIVFDEPTSALDIESETVIRNTIAGMGQDVIRIVIAHRLSTLDACDRLIVLVDGRISEDGPRMDVMETSQFLRTARERDYLDMPAEAAMEPATPALPSSDG